MAPNVYVAADSNHGYKMIAVGREIAEVLRGGHSSLLLPVPLRALRDRRPAPRVALALSLELMRPLIVVSAGFPAYGDYMGLAYARPLEAAGALPLQLPFVRDVDARRARARAAGARDLPRDAAALPGARRHARRRRGAALRRRLGPLGARDARLSTRPIRPSTRSPAARRSRLAAGRGAGDAGVVGELVPPPGGRPAGRRRRRRGVGGRRERCAAGRWRPAARGLPVRSGPRHSRPSARAGCELRSTFLQGNRGVM